jgi:ribosomal protein S18 acetylase RimI-like enzyme
VADVDAILSLIRELAAHEGLAQLGLTRRKLMYVLSSKERRISCLLAISGERAVGLALWFDTFSSLRGGWLIFLEDLVVLPAYRGCGIGKRLMQEVAKHAVRERCPAMVWVTRTSNRKAVAFYKSLSAIQSKESCQFVLRGEALAGLAKGTA